MGGGFSKWTVHLKTESIFKWTPCGGGGDILSGKRCRPDPHPQGSPAVHQIFNSVCLAAAPTQPHITLMQTRPKQCPRNPSKACVLCTAGTSGARANASRNSAWLGGRPPQKLGSLDWLEKLPADPSEGLNLHFTLKTANFL